MVRFAGRHSWKVLMLALTWGLLCAARSAPANRQECPSFLQDTELDTSEKLARAYVDLQMDLTPAILTCMGVRQGDAATVIQDATDTIFHRTIASLRRINGWHMQRFLSAFDAEYPGRTVPIIRINQFDRSLRQAHLPAGFQREEGSLHFSLAEIPAATWPLIFIHELQHLLDPDLAQAMSLYNNAGAVERFTSLAQHGLTLGDLPPLDKQDLSNWIESGLSRGLWGEYRAWAATLILYREGRSSGAFQPDSVLEEMVPFSLSRQPLPIQLKILFRYLNPRFTRPREGPFQMQLFSDAYNQVCRPFDSGDTVPAIHFPWLTYEPEKGRP